jgi:tetratricopeptide (TPR) repeat protein
MTTARRALWPLALALATLAAYLQVRGHEFLGWDDPGYVIANPVLRLGLGWEGLRRILAEPYMLNWIPLTSLSLQIDYRLYGLSPAGYLLTNVALHTLSSLILYAAFARMTGARGRSAFVAAVFALHPLHVESVAWVSERKDVLSGLFFMLGLYAHARFAERPGPGRLALTSLLLLLGLLSKPSLVVFPFVLLLLDVWPLGRIAGRGAALGSSLRRALLEKIPMLLLVAAFAALAFVLQRDAGAMSGLDALPLGARLQNALESYLVYAARSCWPSGLAVFYPHEAGASPLWMGGAAALFLLGVSALVARLARTRPYLAVGWLWYLGTLLPAIGLIQVGSQARADRYMYLPLIGLSILLAWGVHDLLGRLRAPRLAAPAALASLAALWVCTWQQVGHWRNTATLFEHALAVTHRNYLAHEQLADFHLRAGDTAAAERHYREALAIRPDWATARFGLADVRARQGDLAGAIEGYERELRSHPDHPKVAGRYGFALLRAGRLAEARAQLERAVAEDPGAAPLRAALAVAYGQLGQIQEAIASNREAIRLDPGQREAANNLAWLLATRAESTPQEREEAIGLAERATASGSAPAPALLVTLAVAYAAGGRFEEAAATAQRAAALADAQGDTAMARGIRERGELYRAREAYVERVDASPTRASP